MTFRVVAILASASLVSSGAYVASATRAADVEPGAPVQFMSADGSGGAGEKCRVDVLRSGQSGVANVTRSVLENGKCLCTVTTGPANTNGSAEDVVTELLRDRTCDGAPPTGEAQASQAAGGGSGGLIGGLVGALGVGGLAAGLGGKSKG